MVLLQSGPDSFKIVRRPYCRIEVLPRKAALCFCCQCHGVLLSAEGALRISVDCYDTVWPGHLKLEMGIVWHRIEASKCGSSKRCVIATAEGDDVEDQVFASEVVRRSEDNL